MKRYNSWKLVKHKRYVLVQSESSTTSRSFSNWNTFIKAYNTTKNMPTITIPKESAAVRYFSHYTVCYIFFGWQKLKNFREICQGKQTILFDLVFRNFILMQWAVRFLDLQKLHSKVRVVATPAFLLHITL